MLFRDFSLSVTVSSQLASDGKAKQKPAAYDVTFQGTEESLLFFRPAFKQMGGQHDTGEDAKRKKHRHKLFKPERQSSF